MRSSGFASSARATRLMWLLFAAPVGCGADGGPTAVVVGSAEASANAAGPVCIVALRDPNECVASASCMAAANVHLYPQEVESIQTSEADNTEIVRLIPGTDD